MAELLAVTSALCFGITHFVNGLVSRRYPGMLVAAYAQFSGTVVSLVAFTLPSGTATGSSLIWGTVSGLGTGVGVAFLYRAMHRGPMSVVVPISDVAAMALPVVIGVLLLAERPSAQGFAGIVVSIPAIWLVSRGSQSGSHTHAHQRSRIPRGVPDAVIAGVGFAVQFIGMAQVPVGTGWAPVVLSRVVSVAVILTLVARESTFVRLPAKQAGMALAAGAIGTIAIILYLVATQQQMMTIVVVLSALYPAIPVMLALLFLKERTNRTQAIGLLGAGLAIALLALK